MRFFRHSLLVTLLLTMSVVGHVAAQQSPAGADSAAHTADERKVFGWYLMCYSNSVERYRHHIDLARRNGIDGFILDIFEWQRKPGDDNVHHVKSVMNMLEAASAYPDFKLIPCPEYSIGQTAGTDHNFKDLMRRFLDHPNVMKIDGKPVISSYVGKFPNQIKALRAEGYDFYYVPNFWNARFANQWSMETSLNFFRDQPEIDGITPFPTFQTQTNIVSNAIGLRATRHLDKLFIAGVNPHYNSANLRDRKGIDGYAAQWLALLRDEPTYVHVTTWNDYTEDSGLMPGRWPFGAEKQYISRDETYLDVTGYYAAWFKARTQPSITQDKVYVVQRNRRRDQSRGFNLKKAEWEDILYRKYPFDQIHEDTDDRAHVATFLTAPATLKLSLGDQAVAIDAPAGISHHSIELRPGVLHVELHRDGAPIGAFDGRKLVIDKETKENSSLDNGKHKLMRTYTSGYVVGEPLVFEAESGTIANGAELVDTDAGKAVRTATQDKSGVAIPVKGITTGTYNIRVRYRNSGGTESRLTLEADGLELGDNDRAYFIPLTLPPTGDGFNTISFLWSLYEPTMLKVEWQEGWYFNDKFADYSDDIGTADIDRIELVKVDAVEMPEAFDAKLPDLVHIPGGQFVMGKGGIEPDEKPAHDVKISPFYMGRYETTNEQFEMFMPEHRKWRDGYSWRDREPVIYVRWGEAAAYCNWLSEQYGLEPVYDFHLDKKGSERPGPSADLSKNGFHLPTEAQWEYVASGRGENRLYPWGDNKPTPAHGNMLIAHGITDPNHFDPNLRSNEALGSYLVGSFPKGASRDGIMDMAGNVCEWTSSWFHPYSADAKTDPYDAAEAPTEYKAIRGGSWGYYGFSQRTRDREFNSIKYPGYVYIGFRVALPEAGFRKIEALMKQQANR